MGHLFWGYQVEISIVFNQVIMLFLIMITGFIAKKINIITGEVNKKLSELLLNITLPLLIVSSFEFDFSGDMMVNAGVIIACAIFIHVFSIALAGIIYKKYPQPISSVLKYVTVFSNSGFIGFPILDSIYGKTGIFYGAIFGIVFNLFMWTYGVMLFKREKGASMVKNLINPGTIATFIGIILFAFSIRLPAPVFRAVESVGSMTTPLSMLIIGALLAAVDFKKILSGFSIYYASAVRLIVVPVIAFAAFKLAGLTGIAAGVCVVISAMPAAANTAVFAEMFEGDAVFASRAVGISTILSVITIPIVIMLLRYL